MDCNNISGVRYWAIMLAEGSAWPIIYLYVYVMRSSGTASIHDSLRDSLFRRALLKFERDFYQRYLRSFRFSIRNSKYYGPSKQFSSTERPSDLSQNSCNQKRQFTIETTIEMQNICKIPRGPSKKFSCTEKSSD